MQSAVAAMELKLKVLGGKNAGAEIAVAGPQFLIGRADECQLRPKSEYVSRRHAAILSNGTRATIQDLGSRTGTIVNGKALEKGKPIELQHDDTVKIGPLDFSIVIKHGLDRQKKSKVGSLEEAAARTAEKAEDIDVTQWLQPPAEDASLGATIEGPSVGTTILSAAELLGQTVTDVPPPTDEASQDTGADSRPDQAASDMLKNYLRRR